MLEEGRLLRSRVRMKKQNGDSLGVGKRLIYKHPFLYL